MRLLQCALFLLSLYASIVQAEITLKDSDGTVFSLSHPAKRIVTLAPHLTESAFAAGAGGKIVGTVSYSDYPEAAQALPRIGSYTQLDLEAIRALQPDIILAWQSGNSPAQLEKLRNLQLPVFVLGIGHVDELPDALRVIGTLAGTEAQAKVAANHLRERINTLRQRYSTRPLVRTFYQVWNRPLVSIGGKQIINSVMHLCGGENVFAKQASIAPVVSVEAVLAANPEVIMASGMGEARPEWLDDWRRWTNLQAVQRDNLFFIPPDLIQRHTPRLIDGAELFCRHLETARARR